MDLNSILFICLCFVILFEVALLFYFEKREEKRFAKSLKELEQIRELLDEIKKSREERVY